MPIEKFGKYILLVNFNKYLNKFAKKYKVEIYGKTSAMRAATYEDITIINFGMGSPNAATIMDLLTAINPKACLFLGKCGGLKKINNIGDLILPIAAIRGDGTSDDYFPQEIPALPAFALQKAISTTISNEFKEYLRLIRAMAIDMETATIFTTGFYNKIPTGALLLVSDMPMIPEGVKTSKSDKNVDKEFMDKHLTIGIKSLKQLINNSQTVKHLKF